MPKIWSLMAFAVAVCAADAAHVQARPDRPTIVPVQGALAPESAESVVRAQRAGGRLAVVLEGASLSPVVTRPRAVDDFTKEAAISR